MKIFKIIDNTPHLLEQNKGVLDRAKLSSKALKIPPNYENLIKLTNLAKQPLIPLKELTHN